MFDVRSKRIWIGLTVPGKKMVRMLSARGYAEGRDTLLQLYQGPAHTTLLMVAASLHVLPHEGAMGPKLRDIRKSLSTGTGLFGAALTDVRDFLSLRFRVPTRGAAEVFPQETIIEALTQAKAPKSVGPKRPDLVLQYMIAALDQLSRDRDDALRLRDAMSHLVALLRATAPELDPYRGRRASFDEGMIRLEAEMFEEITEESTARE